MHKTLLIILAIFSVTFVFSQDEDSYVYGDTQSNNSDSKFSGNGFDWERVTVGGGLGLTFGTFTIIEISPTFGYYLTDNVLAGIGGNYTYYEDKTINFNTSLYGGRVFGEYIFQDLPILLHTEAEMINIEVGLNERLNIYNLYVGGGFKQQIGATSYFYLLGLWNLNETKESFYIQPNPIIRAGVAIGL